MIDLFMEALNMKKRMIGILFAVICISVLLAGCSKKDKENESGKSSTQEDKETSG